MKCFGPSQKWRKRMTGFINPNINKLIGTLLLFLYFVVSKLLQQRHVKNRDLASRRGNQLRYLHRVQSHPHGYHWTQDGLQQTYLPHDPFLRDACWWPCGWPEQLQQEAPSKTSSIRCLHRSSNSSCTAKRKWCERILCFARISSTWVLLDWKAPQCEGGWMVWDPSWRRKRHMLLARRIIFWTLKHEKRFYSLQFVCVASRESSSWYFHWWSVDLVSRAEVRKEAIGKIAYQGRVCTLPLQRKSEIVK